MIVEANMETEEKPKQPEVKRPFLSEQSGIKTRSKASEIPQTSEDQVIKLLKSIDSKLTFIVLVIGLAIVLTMCNPL
jgi:hypothetical protein